MKSLKITVLIAVFTLTFSGVSSDKNVNVASEQEQIETYKQLKQDRVIIAEVKKTVKKPTHQLL